MTPCAPTPAPDDPGTCPNRSKRSVTLSDRGSNEGVDPTEFIHQLATSGRQATDAEIATIRTFVADQGYEPAGRKRADGAVMRQALTLYGRVLTHHELIPIAERDYLKHVADGEEWPLGTSMDDFVRSLRDTVLNPEGGLFLAMIGTRLALTFVAASGRWRGPNSGGWIRVGYGVDYKYWTAGYQPKHGVSDLDEAARGGAGRWLREPQHRA